jgi:5-methyltetrahydrofolate--homocysteine methyltransferase
LLEQSAQRILITDGAFGTEIQNYGLSEADYAGNLGLATIRRAIMTFWR